MAHWLRLLLPVQGCGFNPQSGSQDPTCVVLVMSDSVAQSCPTLCNPVDCYLPGSSVHGILQARKLEGVTISFSSQYTYIMKNVLAIILNSYVLFLLEK